MISGAPRFYRHQYVKTFDIQRERRKLTVISLVGYTCMGIALIGMGLLASPWLVAESITTLQQVEQRMQARAIFPSEYTCSGEQPCNSPQPSASPNPTTTPDLASLLFAIEIPQIGVNSRVIANVDASNQSEYTLALKQGVAHAFGSAFPGQGQMVYIFGHSTDYAWNVSTWNALFYQVKDLEPGAEVRLTHGDTLYRYKVNSTHVVQPDDTSLLQTYKDQDLLILQTCYPPGTTWQRLLVVAEPIQ